MGRWQRYERATFDADGVALVILSGPPPFRAWTVTNIALTTSSATRTVATVYRGRPADTGLLEATPNRSGNSNTTQTPYALSPGDELSVRWTGGTPGATANCTFQIED